MKSNATACIQGGATVEPETLIERGSAQEVNCERRRGGAEGVGVGGRLLHQIRAWLNSFSPLQVSNGEAKCADVNSEPR